MLGVQLCGSREVAHPLPESLSTIQSCTHPQKRTPPGKTHGSAGLWAPLRNRRPQDRDAQALPAEAPPVPTEVKW